MINAGIVHLGVNWLSPGWLPWTDNGTAIVGQLDGEENVLGNDQNFPGFSNVAQGDLRLLPESPCVDKASALDVASAANFPLLMQYRVPRAGQTRIAVQILAESSARSGVFTPVFPARTASSEFCYGSQAILLFELSCADLNLLPQYFSISRHALVTNAFIIVGRPLRVRESMILDGTRMRGITSTE